MVAGQRTTRTLTKIAPRTCSISSGQVHCQAKENISSRRSRKNTLTIVTRGNSKLGTSFFSETRGRTRVKARGAFLRGLIHTKWQRQIGLCQWGRCDDVIVHTSLPPSPVILWIELGGRQAKMASIEIWTPWCNALRPRDLQLARRIRGERS